MNRTHEVAAPGEMGARESDSIVARGTTSSRADQVCSTESTSNQAGRQASIDERSRLARELHDTVSQTLYGIALGARTALDHLNESPDRAREPVEYVLALADRALIELRAAILDLRPDVLVRAGLTSALRNLIDDARRQGAPDIQLTISALPPLDEAVQVALYRIAAEALNNACRHARARLIQLRYGHHSKGVALDIIDNGIGFEPDRYLPGHFGLASMRERASRVGGEVRVRSHLARGTHVRITLPRATFP